MPIIGAHSLKTKIWTIPCFFLSLITVSSEKRSRFNPQQTNHMAARGGGGLSHWCEVVVFCCLGEIHTALMPLSCWDVWITKRVRSCQRRLVSVKSSQGFLGLMPTAQIRSLSMSSFSPWYLSGPWNHTRAERKWQRALHSFTHEILFSSLLLLRLSGLDLAPYRVLTSWHPFKWSFQWDFMLQSLNILILWLYAAEMTTPSFFQRNHEFKCDSWPYTCQKNSQKQAGNNSLFFLVIFLAVSLPRLLISYLFNKIYIF